MPVTSSVNWPRNGAESQRLGHRLPRIGIPPWMWWWCLWFVLSGPRQLDRWNCAWSFAQATEGDLLRGIEKLASHDPQAPGTTILVYPIYSSLLIDFIPLLALVLGLATVLFPRLRAFALQVRHRLTDPPTTGSLVEISEYVHKRAPGLHVRVNLARQGRIWIYPTGWRRANLAIFAGFVVLWKQQRDNAEAILEHELAHYLRGDALFLGPGSVLEVATKMAVVLFALLVAIPNTAIYIEQAILTYGAAQEVASLERQIQERTAVLGTPQVGGQDGKGIEGPSPWEFVAPVAVTLSLATSSFLIWTTSAFLVPVACMWAAELNADLLACRTPGVRAAILGALAAKSGRTASWWRRTLFRVSHPPTAVRRALIRLGGARQLLPALLVVPAAVVLHDGMMLAWSALNYQALDPTSRHGERSIAFLQAQLHLSSPLTWLAMAAILIAWPALARFWDRISTVDGKALAIADNGRPAGSASEPRISTEIVPYILASAFCGVMAIATIILR